MGLSFMVDKVVLMGQFDPHEVWRLVEAEQANSMMMTGDAMARPLIEALDEEPSKTRDLSSLISLSSTAAVFSPSLKDQYLDRFPNLVLTDAIGSSEGGANGIIIVEKGKTEMKGGPTVTPVSGTVVLDDRMRPVEPGSGVIGRVARTGDIPLGYDNDPVKTAETFVEVDGTRYVIPGDLAMVEADGSVDPARPGFAVDQLGGREDLPGGGRGRGEVTPRRLRRRGGGRAGRALGPACRWWWCSCARARTRISHRCRRTVAPRSPATRCLASCTSSGPYAALAQRQGRLSLGQVGRHRSRG